LKQIQKKKERKRKKKKEKNDNLSAAHLLFILRLDDAIDCTLQALNLLFHVVIQLLGVRSTITNLNGKREIDHFRRRQRTINKKEQ
jgi:hypothetical protein